MVREKFSLNKIFMIFVLLAVFVQFSASIGEEVIPAQYVTDGQEIYLGKIARGQTFSIYINPFVDTGGKFGHGGRYDIAYAKNLPEGWTSKQSSLYGNPLEVLFTVSKQAKEGENKFLVFIKDEGNQEELGIKWFVAKVDVVSDSSMVYSKVYPEFVGVRNPVNIYVEIHNKVDFGNVYNVRVSAKDYLEKTTIYVPANSKRQVVFSTNFNKEGKEYIYVYVEEAGNSDNNFRFTHVIEVEENLLSEYKSIGEGIMLIPVSQALPYYLSYLISSFFG